MELNASHSGYERGFMQRPKKRGGNIAFRFWLIGTSLLMILAAIFDWSKSTREMTL